MDAAQKDSRLGGQAIHHAQKVFRALPVLLARHLVAVVGGLRERAIMIVFLLPLGWIV